MGNVEMSKLKAVTKFDNHKTGSNCPFSYLPTDKDGKIVYDEIRGKLIEISDEKLDYIASNQDGLVTTRTDEHGATIYEADWQETTDEHGTTFPPIKFTIHSYEIRDTKTGQTFKRNFITDVQATDIPDFSIEPKKGNEEIVYLEKRFLRQKPTFNNIIPKEKFFHPHNRVFIIIEYFI